MRSERQRRSVALACALVLLAGCASSGGNASEDPHENRSLLTREQLAPYEHLTAFAAIRQLRPQWLRNTRGQSSLIDSSSSQRGLRVYVDGILYGGAADLRSLAVRAINEARFLDSRQATLQYGTNHAEGAIVITSAR